MAFCTNCGTQLTDSSKFCVNCGQAIGGQPPLGPAASIGGSFLPPTPAAPIAEPLKYDIEGHNLQIARVHLKAGQEIYAEAGKMIYKSSGVDWATRMTGQSIGEKILGAIKRKL